MTSQIWDAGTVSVTNGEFVATGVLTGWQTAAVRYGFFLMHGRLGFIASVDGETSFTFATPWDGPTATGSYAIFRGLTDAVDLVAAYDKFSQSIIRHALTALQPRSAGTIAKRDALVLTDDDDGWVHLHAEDSNFDDWQYYVWTGVADGWIGPQPAIPPSPPAADGVQSSNGSVTDIIALTQSEYDLLDPPNGTTIYWIID